MSAHLAACVIAASPLLVLATESREGLDYSPKGLVRSDLWKAASGGRPQGVPTLGDLVAARDPATNSATFDAAYSLAGLVVLPRPFNTS